MEKKVAGKISFMETWRRQRLVAEANDKVAKNYKRRVKPKNRCVQRLNERLSSSADFVESEIEDMVQVPALSSPFESYEDGIEHEASLPKIQRIEREFCTDGGRSGWCEVKLAALRRSFEFTQRAEFVDTDQYTVKTRLEMLESCWSDFEDACRQWLCSQSNNGSDEYLEQGEDIYAKTKAALRSRLANLTPVEVVQTTLPDNNVLQIQWGDMPSQDKFPKFTGDFASWASFRDAFIAEVHNNERLTNAQRLRKLLASLDGAAKRAVGEWSVADDGNYLLAWTSLRQQYDNNHQTIRAHMQEVSGLRPIREKSSEDLRDVLCTVRVHRRHLLSLLTPTQLVDFQFLHRIEQLLDNEGRREWEMRRRINELPSLDEMFAFLEQRANCMAVGDMVMAVGASRGDSTKLRDEIRNVPRPTISTSQLAAVNQPSRRSGPTQSHEQKRMMDYRKCFKCELPGHPLFHCDQFKAMQLSDRREFVNKKRLCESCFSPNHLTISCRKDFCRNCPGVKHNSSICSSNPKYNSMVARATVTGDLQ